MRSRPAHQSMINRRHDDCASCPARQSLKKALERKPRIDAPATYTGGHEIGHPLSAPLLEYRELVRVPISPPFIMMNRCHSCCCQSGVNKGEGTIFDPLLRENQIVEPIANSAPPRPWRHILVEKKATISDASGGSLIEVMPQGSGNMMCNVHHADHVKDLSRPFGKIPYHRKCHLHVDHACKALGGGRCYADRVGIDIKPVDTPRPGCRRKIN